MEKMSFIKKSSFHSFVLMLSLFCLFSFLPTKAQTAPTLPSLALPETPDYNFLISWKANNYVPSDYQGRIMPSKNSEVEVSFDLLDKGTIIDISKQQINWNLNHRSLRSGIGLQSIKITFNSNSEQLLEIELPDYKDAKYKMAYLDYFIKIPGRAPEVVINAPYPNNIIKIGQNPFQALPYFFNITNLGQLKFEWSVDGQKQTNSQYPHILGLDLSSLSQPQEGSNTSIEVFTQNLSNQLEFATQNINLDIK
jgi:hypothetical protein